AVGGRRQPMDRRAGAGRNAAADRRQALPGFRRGAAVGRGAEAPGRGWLHSGRQHVRGVHRDDDEGYSEMGGAPERRPAPVTAIRSSCAVLLAAGIGLGVAPTLAQHVSGWPSRPIRLVVPACAGGIADAVARLLGEGLGKRLGQPVVLDNVAGAASMIGTAAVAKAQPDGYTLLIGAIAPLGIVPHVRKTPYVVERDLAPVGVVA